MRIVIASLLAFALAFTNSFALPTFAFSTPKAHADTTTTSSPSMVKVGYMDQAGVLTRHEDGTYSGYTYDYLMHIAQFTGWTYEFVEAQGATENEQALNLIEMLNTGTVDIEGGLAYNSSLATLYEYPQNSYGTTRTALFIPNTNATISSTNLYTREKVRVALSASSKQRREELVAFCQKNNINLEVIECRTIEEMQQATLTGQADAFLAPDLNVHEGFSIVASLVGRPYFFAAPKGQRHIIDEIDLTIQRLNDSNPALQETLYGKYFNTALANFALTESERAYAEQHKPLRVGIISEKAPLQSFDEKTHEFKGITKGVLDCVTERTGFTFEIVKIERSDNISETIKNLDIDLIGGTDAGFTGLLNMNISLTAPYVSTSKTLVYNRFVNPDELQNKRLALSWEMKSSTSESTNISYYDSFEECFKAVNDGRADYTYGTSYTTPYYQSANNLENILTLPTLSSTIDVSFGLVQPIEPELLVLLDKAIRSLTPAELDAVVYNNSLIGQEEQVTQFISDHLPEFALACIAMLVIIIVLMSLYLRARIRSARNIREENNRFQTIFNLANEQFFEYSLKDDTLLVSKNKNISSSDSTDINDPLSSSYYTIKKAREFLKRTESAEVVEAFTHPTKITTEALSAFDSGEKQWLRITSLFVTGDGEQPVSVVGKVANITDEMQEKMDLSERAHRDGLTGLLNWKTFQERADLLLKKGNMGALLVIDTDDFKQVNDTYGHQAGDLALFNTGAALKKAFRSQDLIGRLGGDEFSVCINGAIDLKNLEDRCNAMVKAGVSFVDQSGKTHVVTLSVGCITLIIPSTAEFQQVYHQADKALYRAKAEGKQRFIINEFIPNI